MTWIPCLRCGGVVCMCRSLAGTGNDWQQTFEPAQPRLSDEDVERIARRVAELLKAELAAKGGA